MRRRRSTWQALGAAAIVAAIVLAVLPAAASSRTAAKPPCRKNCTPPPTPACGTRTGPPATYAHVIWIWMENHSYSEIIGSSSAPTINALAQGCGLATNYTAVTHPSLPNYIAATSGGPQGIADDNAPASHPLSVVSLFEQAAPAGSYQESMPSSCLLTSSGTYAVKHNPEAYYTRVRTACATDDLPMGTTSSGAFLSALNAGTLPRFSFVTPNLCNDMHDCSVTTGDNWLKAWVPKIVASPSYQAGDTVLVLAWDEDDNSAGNKVPLVVVSPYTVPGTRSSAAFTHYSLLRTTEELLGISTFLGNAASAASMRSAFGL